MDQVSAYQHALAPFREALDQGNLAAARAALVRMSAPLGSHLGAGAFVDAVFSPLRAAWPDREPREVINICGVDQHGAEWVSCSGQSVGRFMAPWLDIPPAGHLVHMRFVAFFRLEDGLVVEMQALWDISEVMMQATRRAMDPSSGREMMRPEPATCDGLRATGDGPEAQQIMFLNAMPDRGQYRDMTQFHVFAAGASVAVSGWPNMVQRLSDGGWMGSAPVATHVALRSVDVWRIERGVIRETRGMVDLLTPYAQLGVDGLALE